MDQAAVEQDHRASRSSGTDDAAFFVTRALHQLGDECVVDRPKGITGGGEVMLGIDHAFFVASGDEHQRAIEFIDIVQKDSHVHRALGGHHVVVEPSAVILVPLPHITFKRHLAVDFELVHVEFFAKQIFHGLHHAGVARQFGKGLAVHVRSKVGPNRLAAFFAHVVSLLAAVQLWHGIY